MSSDLDQEFMTATDAAYLAQCMNQKYAYFIKERAFSINAAVDQEWVVVKVVLANADDSFHYPVEARIKFESEEMAARDAALFLIDYIDLYFEEFLEEGEATYVPIDWTKHQYDASEFEMRGQIFNLKVERMGDDLLTRGTPYEGPNLII